MGYTTARYKTVIPVPVFPQSGLGLENRLTAGLAPFLGSSPIESPEPRNLRRLLGQTYQRIARTCQIQ